MTQNQIEDSRVTRFLKFLHSHAVHVRDSSQLALKITEIARDGPQSFQIISDFDRTLTPQWLNDPCSKTGKLVSCHSSHGVIESSTLVSPEYGKHTKALAEYYIPMEHDIKLSREDKIRISEEWYHKAHSCMLNENLTQGKLDKIVASCWSNMEIHLRNKFSEFIKASRDHGLPVTVLSAGLGDVIERILRLETPSNYADLMVVANRMLFDTEGTHKGFSDPVIHAFNKRNALTKALLEDEQRVGRKNALLMGDLIGDVDFVHSVPHLSAYLAIGFLADGSDHEERVEEYLKHFDIVITGGSATMDVPIALLEALFS
jgi:HAD superfamily hydrolase (TIGR01544 family)